MDLQKLIDKNNSLELEQIQNLENDIKDINKIYKNINEIINTQGEVIDRIENNMDNTLSYVETATTKLSDAESYFKSYKYYQYVLYGLAVIGTILIII